MRQQKKRPLKKAAFFMFKFKLQSVVFFVILNVAKQNEESRCYFEV